MVEITLRDPGMHDKYVEVRTLAEVDGVLEKNNRHYTTAIVINTETLDRDTKVYKREICEREWK